MIGTIRILCLALIMAVFVGTQYVRESAAEVHTRVMIAYWSNNNEEEGIKLFCENVIGGRADAYTTRTHFDPITEKRVIEKIYNEECRKIGEPHNADRD